MRRSDLIKFIQSNLLQGNGTIEPDESLIDRGIVTSIGLMQITQFVESNAGVRIPDHMVLPENFQSVEAIEQMVEKLRS